MKINNYIGEKFKCGMILHLLNLIIFSIFITPWTIYADGYQESKILSDKFFSIGYELGYRNRLFSDDRFIKLDNYSEYGASIEAKIFDDYSLSAIIMDAEPGIDGFDQGIEYERYSIIVRRFFKTIPENPACCWRGFLGLGYTFSNIGSVDRPAGSIRSDESYSGIVSAGMHRRFGNYFLVEGGARVAIDLDNGTTELNPFLSMKFVVPVFQTISIKSRGFRASSEVESSSFKEKIPSNSAVTAHDKISPLVSNTQTVVENTKLTGNDSSAVKDDKCEEILQADLVDEIQCENNFTDSIRRSINLLFENNQSNLQPESFIEVKNLSQFLKTYPASILTVIGYTDDVGDEDKNRELSLNRAMSVKSLLVQAFGISPSRIDVMGLGEANPLYRNDSSENRKLNRRVEIIIKSGKDIVDVVE